MATRIDPQCTIKLLGDTSPDLELWIESFLLDRKAQNMSKGTLYFYRAKLRLFMRYCETQAITRIDQVSADTLRQYLLWLAGTNHNEGGVHACYRTTKTFLRWYEAEAEPEGWTNPITRVRAPRVSLEPLDPVTPEVAKALMTTCNNSFVGVRDRAILTVLYDTGLRSAELLALSLEDVDLIHGAILVRNGKGRKPRMGYLGKAAKKAMKCFLKKRESMRQEWLWLTRDGYKLGYSTLRDMLGRRAKLAGVEAPTLHSFRRAFALGMLRSGVSVYAVQRLMGHADLQVLTRYLKLVEGDLKAAHDQGSPADRL